jgi:hypothetical protein
LALYAGVRARVRARSLHAADQTAAPWARQRGPAQRRQPRARRGLKNSKRPSRTGYVPSSARLEAAFSAVTANAARASGDRRTRRSVVTAAGCSTSERRYDG